MILPDKGVWFAVVVGNEFDVELSGSFSVSGSGERFKDELLELLYNVVADIACAVANVVVEDDDVLFINEENTLCGSNDVSNMYRGELVTGSWIPVLYSTRLGSMIKEGKNEVELKIRVKYGVCRYIYMQEWIKWMDGWMVGWVRHTICWILQNLVNESGMGKKGEEGNMSERWVNVIWIFQRKWQCGNLYQDFRDGNNEWFK